MEQILKDLECVQVESSDNGQKKILTFYSEELGEIREVQYNRQKYDQQTNKYVDDVEKAESVEKMIADELGLTFDTLDQAVGMKKDVYSYDSFNSLHQVDQVQKFTKEMVGEIFQTELKEVRVDDFGIHLRYEIGGQTYESKMMHGKYLENMKKWMKDPQKKAKVYKRFEEKFYVPVEKADTLIGHPIMVECKCAFGSAYYGDIKKFPKK